MAIYRKDENSVDPSSLNNIFMINMEINSDVDIKSISNIDVKKALNTLILYSIRCRHKKEKNDTMIVI